MPGPLSGIKVVDVSAVVSGPLATMMLADQGADVVRIEPHGLGDTLRLPNFERGGLTAFFANTNRGKRSIVLDLTKPAGRDILCQMVRDADVFLQNWRPGAAARLKLGEPDLRELNPNLIYCSISGYGPTGPYAQRRVYDPIIQALTGNVAIQRHHEIQLPDLVRNVICDKASAYTAAQAITAALLARERGEEGQTISVSLLDAGLAFLWPDGAMKHTFIGDGVREGPALYERYRLTETKDGHIVMWAGADNEWHAVFRALDRAELCEDERFATGRARAENNEVLGGILYNEFRKWTTAEIVRRMDEAEVPGGPVLALDEVPDNPQVQHNQTIYEVDHPTAGRMRHCRPAALFSGTQAEPAPVAPLLGEHTDEVLSEAGFDADTIAAMREDGAVR